MELLLDINTKGNFDTELYNILSNIPNNILFNFEHELRRPITIYQRARERVFKAFEDLLKVVQIKSISFESIDWGKIDEAHQELLDSIMSFTDDGYNIIKCFYPKSRGKKEEKSAVEWLKKVEPKLMKECNDNVYSYRKRIGLIDNKIKHEHGRYQHLQFSFSYYQVYGYYIDSVDKDGVFQPNEKIHPKFNGKRTAISYNKDIRELLINVYLIADQFATAIKKIVYKEHNIQLSSFLCSVDDNDRILELFKNINGLQEAFFLDEYVELPQFIISENKTVLRKPAYKSYINKLLKPNSYSVLTVNTLEDECIMASPYMEVKNNKKI
ncbi:hypothetical protein [Clostridium sp. UBA1056]|uniref:hypothetical protein n=1 Tax=unclassified Clostridium TaxID=2614128 RepID=UPI003216BD0D